MPGLDPPELHQLADQALHARRVVLHDADMLGDVGREAVTVEQLLARPVDQRQGGAELVGDAGEKAEFRLVVVALLLPAHRLHQQPAPLLDPVVDHEPDDVQHHEREQQVDHVGPHRVPPRRTHPDMQRSGIVAPDFVAVGTSHAEFIGPGRHVGEHRRVVGADLHPVVVEPLEDVGVFAVAVADVFQRRELDAEKVFAVRQDDLAVGTESGHGRLLDQEIVELHGRGIRPHADVAGIEPVEPGHSAEVHPAVARTVIGTVGKFVALQLLVVVIADYPVVGRVQLRQPLVGTEPKVARVVLQDTVDGVVRQPVLFDIPAETAPSPCGGAEPVQTVARPDPERRVAPGVERQDVVAADRIIARGGRVMGKLAAAGVEEVQPAAARSDPQFSAAGRDDREHRIVAQRGGVLLVVDIDPLPSDFVTPARLGQLQPDQPVAVRPEPHAAVRRIAVNRIHRTEIGARDGFDGRDAPRGTRKHIEPGAVVPDEQVVAESPGEGVDGIITQSPGYVADRAPAPVGTQHADAVAFRGDIDVPAAVLAEGAHGAIPVAENPAVGNLVELDAVVVYLEDALPVAADPQDVLTAVAKRKDVDAGHLRHPAERPPGHVADIHVRRPGRYQQVIVAILGDSAHLTTRGGEFAHCSQLPVAALVAVNFRIGRNQVERRPAVEHRLDPAFGEEPDLFPHLHASRRGQLVTDPNQLLLHGMQQQGILSAVVNGTYLRRVELRDIECRKPAQRLVVAGDAPPRGGTEDGAVGRGRDREHLLGRGAVVLVAGVEAFDAVVFHVDAVDPVVGGDPEDALRLLDDVADDVVRNRIRIVRRELVSPEAVTVVGIQAVPCPEPHHQGRILIDAVDRTVRQPVRAGQRIVLEGGHGGRHGNPNRRQQQENQLFRHNASHVVTKICFYTEP